jgi:hypothetical protein
VDEPWPDDILAVACMRVDRAPRVIPGSVFKTCWKCEAAVWTSPATLEHVRDKPHRFLCMECAFEQAARDKDSTFEGPTAGQIQELLEALRPPEPPPPGPKQRGKRKRR